MEEEYSICLTLLEGVGPVTAGKLLQKYGSARAVLEECERFTSEKEEALERAKRILEDCHRLGITLIDFNGPLYMNTWRTLPDFPPVLYAKGNIIPEKMTGIGVVGARRCTKEGKQKAIEIATEAVLEGKTVISGMAKGIDSYAHTAALKNGGCTIAVLGNGVDLCYPPEHAALFRAIIESGIILSEYPPGTNPQRFNFPRRNRIIAALSEKLYVIDAGAVSGTRTTIDAARRYGREVVSFHF